ncbi:MAG: hypothetical protein HRU28_08465, partial [Rhizobiales bacterium]|nr:hypothetical protein [Hyphomicrobiales bacterium]
DKILDGVWMNEGGRIILHRADIKQALKFYVIALVILVLILLPFSA